jgi:pyruvate dehydrogenase E1 component beta subunit
LLREAIRHPDPVIYFEPKKLYWSKGPVDPTVGATIGKAEIVRPGTDVTLLAYGPSVRTAIEAAEAAEAEGRSLQVVDIRTLTPFDDETVMAAVRSTGRAIVISEAPGFASVASEIAARVSERCFSYLEAPVRRVTGFDVPYPAPSLEHFFLPDVDRILDTVDSLYLPGES